MQIRMFLHKISKIHQLQKQDYSQHVATFQTSMNDTSSDSSFLRKIVSCDECGFHVSSFRACKTLGFGAQKTQNASTIQIRQRKVTIWRAVYSNDVVCPYYFSNELFRWVDYYPMLHTDVLSEAQNVAHNAVFHQNGAPPHTKCPFHFFLNDMLLNPWIGRCAQTNWPARSPDWAPLDFIVWGFLKVQVCHTSVTKLTQLEWRITTTIRLLVRKFITIFEQILKIGSIALLESLVDI